MSKLVITRARWGGQNLNKILVTIYKSISTLNPKKSLLNLPIIGASQGRLPV